MSKTVVTIQARMGSSRLPGKMLHSLGTHSILEWVLRRTMISAEPNAVVLALPDTSENDVLEANARKLGCDVYRGSEDDVLARLTRSTQKYDPDTVVRVCADRPLIDPVVLDETVRMFHRRPDSVDMMYSHKAGPNADWPYGFGVEVFSFDRMNWLNDTVTSKTEREHVTLHMWNNEGDFQIEALPCPAKYSALGSNAKLDLDTSDDLERLQKVVKTPQDIFLPGHVFVERAVKLGL